MSERARVICRQPNHCEIYKTAHSEYHVHMDMHGKVCVAVVNQASQRENPSHRTVGLHLQGSLRFDSTGGITPHTLPEIGDRLLFAKSGREEHYQSVLSGELISIETS